MRTSHLAAAGFAIVLGQLSLNIGAAMGKGLFPQVGAEGVAALRTTIAALILLAIARPWDVRMTKPQLGFLMLYGLMLGAMTLLIYWSFQTIPIGIAVAIEVTGPLAVVLLTSRSAKDFLWLALAVLSLMLLVPWPGQVDALDPMGIAYALGGAVCWALYIVCGKQASRIGGKAAVALGMSIACMVTLPFGLATAGTGLIEPSVLALGVVVAVLSSAVPFSLEMAAMGRLSSRLFGVISSGAPAMGALAGYMVLGEELTGTQWLAVCAMIAANAGCALTSRPQTEASRPADAGQSPPPVGSDGLVQQVPADQASSVRPD